MQHANRRFTQNKMKKNKIQKCTNFQLKMSFSFIHHVDSKQPKRSISDSNSTRRAVIIRINCRIDETDYLGRNSQSIFDTNN